MARLFLLALLIFVFSTRTIGQVQLQTGSATFGLPIFGWQDDFSRLNASVSLNYNSGSGLKVNELSSNVGQGWNLAAGGSITRMQVGEPDDQKQYFAGSQESSSDVTKYPNGYLYNTENLNNGCPTSLTKYPIYKHQNQLYKQHNAVVADREADYFAFTFNGRSGIFILNKTNLGQSFVLGDSRLNVTFTTDETMTSFGVRTTINGFTIVDENGLIYRFGNPNSTVAGRNLLGRSKLLKTSYCDPSFTHQWGQPKFKNSNVYFESNFEDPGIVNPYVINSWQLAEIEDGLTHRKIYFNYNNARNINARAGIDVMHFYSNKDYVLVSNKISKSISPQLGSITFPDGHDVVFNYGAARIDLSGDYILKSIDIKYNSRFLSKYDLNQSYFIRNRYGTPVSDQQKSDARLCLISIVKYGLDLKVADKPYIFDYYLGSNASDDFVAPPFFHMKDIWGYFNGSNNKGFDASIISMTAPIQSLSYKQLHGLCYLRANESVPIINPKAGYAKNGLLKQIIYPTGGSLIYEYGQNTGILNNQSQDVAGVHVTQTKLVDGDNNTCSNPLTTNYNYVEANGSSSMWGIEFPLNGIGSETYYEPEYKRWKIPFGCKYEFLYPGILSREQAINLTDLQQMLLVVGDVMSVVGNITTVIDIINVCFGASGVGLVITAVTGLIEFVLTCLLDPSKTTTTTVYYNFDLNGSNPLPMQFRRAEVTQHSGGEWPNGA